MIAFFSLSVLVITVTAVHGVAPQQINVPMAANAPELDGRLDDAVWQQALRLGPLVGPINAKDDALVARYPTIARLLWTPDALYIAFECKGPAPSSSFKLRDDPLHEADVVEVFLDARGDMTHYVELQSGPTGVLADYRHDWAQPPTYPAHAIDQAQVKAHHKSDRGWDLRGLKSVTTPPDDDDTWIVEMRIPIAPVLRDAGLPEALREGQELGLNLLRYAYELQGEGKKKHVHLNLIPTMKGQPHVSPMAMQRIRLVKADPAAQNGP